MQARDKILRSPDVKHVWTHLGWRLLYTLFAFYDTKDGVDIHLV